MSNILKPGKIYLQLYADNHGNTTWCEDKINDTDIEYIRSDIVESQLEQARADKAELLNKLKHSYHIVDFPGCKQIEKYMAMGHNKALDEIIELLEQALGALKRANGVLELYQCGITGGCPCEAGNCEIIQIREAIKALEECIK